MNVTVKTRLTDNIKHAAKGPILNGNSSYLRPYF